MKKSIISFVVLGALVVGALQINPVSTEVSASGPCTANTWTQKADFGGTTRLAAVGFSIGQFGYLGTGTYSSGDKKDFWQYDPATDVWTQKADFGGAARRGAVGFSIGDKGYLGTGAKSGSAVNPEDAFKDFWQYNPTTNLWTKKADFPGKGRALATSFAIGSKGYVGAGLEKVAIYQFTTVKDFWEYNSATDAWSKKADIGGVARINATGFSLADSSLAGGKGYLGTGNPNTGGALLKDFWEYNPTTNTWGQKADVGGEPRDQAVGMSILDKGYIGTGRWFGNTYQDFWQYNSITNTWTEKDSIAEIYRYGAVAFSIGGKGYISTGGPSYTDLWEYCGEPEPTCSPNTWTQKVGFTGIGRFRATGFSIGNKGYIGTGINGIQGNLKDLWEYDKSTNVWTQKADFGGTARIDAVGFAVGTKGYIGTGTPNGLVGYKDFWEYDSVANTWIQKSDFSGLERHDAVGFSIGDKGFIGTGLYNNLFHLEDFWEYNSVTDSWIQRANLTGGLRQGAVGFSIGNKGYIGTGGVGSNQGTNNFKDFWEYDPIANGWTQKADFGGIARRDAMGFSIGVNKGYIGTGYGVGGVLRDFWKYDSVTNTWTQKANAGGAARTESVGFSIGDRGYIGTGVPSSSYLEYCPD